MHAFALLAALAAFGVEAGYEPAADGELEYIIQIEPNSVARLASGKDLTSEVPRDLNPRHFRLTIGTGKLPHIDKQTAARQVRRNPLDEPEGEETSQIRLGYQPLGDGEAEFVIEIYDLQVLDDLHRSDLTGDLPADVAITRFRISTEPGSAAIPPVATPDGQVRETSALGSDPAAEASDLHQGTLAQRPPDGQLTSGAHSTFQAPALSNDDHLVDVPPQTNPLAPAAIGGAQPGTPTRVPTLGRDGGGGWHPGELPQDTHSAPLNSAPLNSAPLNSAPLNGAPLKSAPLNTAGAAARNPATSRRALGDEPPPSGNPLHQPEIHRNSNFRDETAESNPEWDRPLRGEERPASQRSSDGTRGKNASTAGKSATHSTSDRAAHSSAEPANQAKPWLPLTLTLMVLCLSLGANVYLAWVAWDARNRCRNLLQKLHGGELTASS